MHATWMLRYLLTGLVTCGLLLPAGNSLGADESGAPSDPVFVIGSVRSNIAMTETTARTIAHSRKIKSVTGFDESVVKVLPTDTPDRVRVIALEAGVTQIQIGDEDNQVFTIDILVEGDVRYLEGIIREKFGDSRITCTKVKQAVLLQGWVTQPYDIVAIVDIAKQFFTEVINRMDVAGAQTVQLNVRLMEVQRGKIRRLGFNWLYLRDSAVAASTIGGLVPIPAIATPLGGPAAATLTPVSGSSTPPTGAFAIVDANQAFQGFIEALKDESLLKIVSEPNLVTINGSPAQFLSGGEFPVPVPQGLGTVSIQFKKFGAQLDFVPFMLGNGRLKLDVRPEVSEQDFRNVVTVQGITVPSLSTRRVQTTVEMNFGQTLVIAGLLNNRVQARQVKVPFFGELPYIGTAFRRTLNDESETELIIMVTPEYVAPMDPSQVPPGGPGRSTVVPTDMELYRDGYVEVPKYGPDPGFDELDIGGTGSAAGGYGPPGIPMNGAYGAASGATAPPASNLAGPGTGSGFDGSDSASGMSAEPGVGSPGRAGPSLQSVAPEESAEALDLKGPTSARYAPRNGVQQASGSRQSGRDAGNTQAVGRGSKSQKSPKRRPGLIEPGSKVPG